MHTMKMSDIFGGLCRRSFIVAFVGSLLTILTFDVMWCTATTFAPFAYFSTYLYAVALAFIMSLPALLPHGRWWMIPVLALADGLALANLIYGRTYFAPIPPISYMLAGTAANYGGSIFSSMWIADALFPLLTIATVAFMGRTTKARNAWPAYGMTLACLILICGIDTAVGGSPYSRMDGMGTDKRIVAYTLPMTLAHDYVRSEQQVPDSSRRQAVASLDMFGKYRDMRELSNDKLTPLSYTPSNVVFIILESFEAWPLNARIEGKEITPHLNRLIADSATWVGRRVLSQVAHGRSMDGQLELTTGLMPLNEMSFPLKYADNAFPHLAKVLKSQRGTKNYLLASNSAESWNSGKVTAGFGFDKRLYSDSWDCTEKFEGPDNPADESFMKQIIARMKSGEIWPVGEKAFIEILTFSSHTPFLIPEEHRSIHLTGDYPAPFADYVTAVNYTDAAVGRLVDYIKSRPDTAETMIVLAGDHEALATWRRSVRAGSPELAKLVDDAPYVPLIILNAPYAGRREAVMGQVDVYPTILSQAGLDGNMRGKSLLSDNAFRGLGISALSPLSPSYAVELNGKVHGDTARADQKVLKHVLAMPSVSSTLIRSNAFAK